MGRIIVRQGQGAGVEYALEGSSFIIGRGKAYDLRITDPKSSRKHAEVFVEEGRYYLRDLASSNGTFHNRKRLTGDVLLASNDRFSIGATVLEFVEDTAVAPVAEALEAAPAEAAAQAEAGERPRSIRKLVIVVVLVLALLGAALGTYLALKDSGEPQDEPIQVETE